ncbi:MAG TPA: pyrroline-5-carboxylate reductase, partial [Polyangiales bacterium]
MALSQRISFIGGGNMASALIQGLIAAGTARPEQITASDVREAALRELRDKHGIHTTTDNALACGADIVVLSVKPQVFASLLTEIGAKLGADTLVISIAAGVPLSAIEARLGEARVVRAMPNTPALVGAGATALATGKHATQADGAVAEQIFQSVGITVSVPEELMDAVTAVSGSGPAYVFLLAEALTEAGVRVGLPLEAASKLATQTVYGSGKLLHG